MRKLSVVMMMVLASTGAFAQKAADFIGVDDIFRIVTSRYITMANEEADAEAVMDLYDEIITPYGYVHELPGDGYGGPCSIIDGYYKGGVNDVAQARFVPKDEMASVIFISACNMGDDSDYGYPEVTLTVYSERAVEAVFAQIVDAGFEQFQFDNPEEAGDAVLFYNGDRQVVVTVDEWGYNFEFSIAE